MTETYADNKTLPYACPAHPNGGILATRDYPMNNVRYVCSVCGLEIAPPIYQQVKEKP